MKKKTEQQLRDINPVSAVTGVANESVDTIEDTDILRSKTSNNNNGGFFS